MKKNHIGIGLFCLSILVSVSTCRVAFATTVQIDDQNQGADALAPLPDYLQPPSDTKGRKTGKNTKGHSLKKQDQPNDAADKLGPVPDYLRGKQKKPVSDFGPMTPHVYFYGDVSPTFFNMAGLSSSQTYNSAISSAGYPHDFSGNINNGLGGGIGFEYGNDIFTGRINAEGDNYAGMGIFHGQDFLSIPLTTGATYTYDHESWADLYAAIDLGASDQSVENSWHWSFVGDVGIGARFSHHLFAEIRAEWMSQFVPGLVSTQNGMFLVPVSIGMRF